MPERSTSFMMVRKGSTVLVLGKMGWFGYNFFRISFLFHSPSLWERGGRVVRWCWVHLQCRGVLLIWFRVGQGLILLAVGASGGCLDIFFSSIIFLSPSLWETARYRLKYCLKGPLSPKQPTNQSL